MEQKQRTYKFAGRESSPKARYGITRIREFDEGTWYHNHFDVSRALGHPKYEVRQMFHEGCGASGSGHSWYDVRIIPAGFAKQLKDIDDFINELRMARQNILNEHFAEWDIATQADCSTVHPVNPMGKADAEAKCKELNKNRTINVEQEQSERQMISKINQAISGTLIRNTLEGR